MAIRMFMDMQELMAATTFLLTVSGATMGLILSIPLTRLLFQDRLGFGMDNLLSLTLEPHGMDLHVPFCKMEFQLNIYTPSIERHLKVKQLLIHVPQPVYLE
jgi:hypothetical protein